MAKMNKIMPPRNTTIRGQDHLLAYITPEEAQLLMDNGGAGKPGPMGIPAFYSDDDDTFAGAAMESFQDDFGGGGGGDEYEDTANLDDLMAGAAARNRIDASNAALFAAAQNKPKVQQVYDDTNYGAATDPKRVAQSYFDYANIFAPSVFSSKRIGGDFFGGLKKGSLATMLGVPSYSSWFAPNTPERRAFADMAIQQMKNQQRLENAGNVPSPIAAMIGGYNVKSMMEDLENGGRPALDKFGKVQGVFSEGPFGEVYQGNPIDGLEETGWTPYDTQGGSQDQTVKPVNPVTGQCDEGYMFDEDLQACRLDTGGVSGVGGIGGTGNTFAPGTYARMGLLDVAPTGLPEFSEQYGIPSQDFDAANLAFRRGTGTQAGIFQDPYDLTGYSLLG